MATRRRREKPTKSTEKTKEITTEEAKNDTTEKAKTEELLELQSSRKSFLEALSFIKPGIASGSIIEQSDLVLMDENRLVSYNDEIAVSHPYPIGYTGGVYANELHKLLQKLPTDKIEIGEAEEDGQNQLVLRCDSVEAGFNIVKDVTVPELGIDEIDNWMELPSDFCHGAEFCVSSAATDITKGILTCINAKEKVIMSCDNFRATKYHLKDGLPEGVILNIPRTATKELSKYAPKEVAWDDNWIHFRNDVGTIFSARTMSGEYPDVDSLFADTDGEKIPLPKDLKKSLGRTEILADDDQKSKGKVVNISIDKGMIVCKGQGPSGWVTEKIKTTFKGTVPEFAINPALLAQILEVANEAVLTSRVLLFEGKGFAHVVALISKE